MTSCGKGITRHNRPMLTYVVCGQKFDKVVRKHADATLQLTFPPAGVDDVLLQHRDDISLRERQLIFVRSGVWESNDRARFGCKHATTLVQNISSRFTQEYPAPEKHQSPGFSGTGIIHFRGISRCNTCTLATSVQTESHWKLTASRDFKFTPTAIMHQSLSCSSVVSHKNAISLSQFNGHFSRWIGVSWYQNVSTLVFVGAKDDGGDGDSCNYKTGKAPVKSSPPTNQHPTYYRPGAPPLTQPTVSKHRRG